MSVVIEFRAVGARAPRQGADLGEAQIIIFPGIRIERREAVVADRPTIARKWPSAANQATEFDGD
jgi:hypothetical protein